MRGPAFAYEPLLEYDQTEHPTRQDLVRPLISHQNGYVPVPAAPGLGITVQRDVLARYTTTAETVATL